MPMTITEVTIKPAQNEANPRIQAYATACFEDAFVVRDMKIVRGVTSGYIVGMPSRKLMDHCPDPLCGRKNCLTAKYCNECGVRLNEYRALEAAALAGNGRPVLYADMAHPITSEFREVLDAAVLEAFHGERRDGGASATTAPLGRRIGKAVAV